MSAKIFNKLCRQIVSVLDQHSIIFARGADSSSIDDFFYFLIGYHENDEIRDFVDEEDIRQEKASPDSPLFPTNILNVKVSLKKFFSSALYKAILSKRDWDISALYIRPKKDEPSTINDALKEAYTDLAGIYSQYFPFAIVPADAIYYNTPQTPFSEFSEIIENLNKYLQDSMDLYKLPVTNILPPFIKRLQPTVKLKNNPKQKKVSCEQEDWWGFVYNCIEYCQFVGDFPSAKAIINLLQYPDKTDILYSRSHTDKPILSALNAWLENAPTFDGEIDNAIATVQKLLKDLGSTGYDPCVYMPNMVIYTYTLSLLFDKILTRYATDQYRHDRLDYETIFVELWNSSEPFRCQLMPQLKQNYYANLMWTLFSSDDDFINDHPRLFHDVALKYENIELKIRLLSALAIQCSNVIEIDRLDKKYFILLYRFINDELFPELLKTINKTLHLPRYTFYICLNTLLSIYKIELRWNGGNPQLPVIF